MLLESMNIPLKIWLKLEIFNHHGPARYELIKMQKFEWYWLKIKIFNHCGPARPLIFQKSQNFEDFTQIWNFCSTGTSKAWNLPKCKPFIFIFVQQWHARPTIYQNTEFSIALKIDSNLNFLTTTDPQTQNLAKCRTLSRKIWLKFWQLFLNADLWDLKFVKNCNT